MASLEFASCKDKLDKFPGGFMRGAVLLFALGLAVWGLACAAISSTDLRTLLQFRDASNRWADGTMDPRQVLREYADFGSKSVNTRMFGIPAYKMLPSFGKCGAGDSSHYEAFSKGPEFALGALLAEHRNPGTLSGDAEVDAGKWIMHITPGDRRSPAAGYGNLVNRVLQVREWMSRCGLAAASAGLGLMVTASLRRKTTQQTRQLVAKRQLGRVARRHFSSDLGSARVIRNHHRMPSHSRKNRRRRRGNSSLVRKGYLFPAAIARTMTDCTRVWRGFLVQRSDPTWRKVSRLKSKRP